MISQHWFRQWLGAIGQQAITWANVDPDLCRHMVSLGQNELNSIFTKTHLPVTYFSIAQSFWNFAQSMGVTLPCAVQNDWATNMNVTDGGDSEIYKIPSLNWDEWTDESIEVDQEFWSPQL